MQKPMLPPLNPKRNPMSVWFLSSSSLLELRARPYYYIKFVKGRKPKDEDMDFFDDEATRKSRTSNEDDEPQIAEDAETDGDED